MYIDCSTLSKPDKAAEEVCSALVEKPSSAGQNSPFQISDLDEDTWWSKSMM